MHSQQAKKSQKKSRPDAPKVPDAPPVRAPTHAKAAVFQAERKKKLRTEASAMIDVEPEKLVANVSSVREGRKRCPHMGSLAVPCIMTASVIQLEYFVGRMPAWYPEIKFLKEPGDYVLYRNDVNKLTLAVKTKEPGNPVAHFQLEFTETRLVRTDRNCYHRLVGTLLQDHTVHGLMTKYVEGGPGFFKRITGRDAELRHGIMPCQFCLYDNKEYNYHYLFVRTPKDVITKEKIEAAKGEGYQLFKGTHTINDTSCSQTRIVRNVIIKEFQHQTKEVLNAIFYEMHIVQTVRFKIGVNTAVSVEGISTMHKPFHIMYTVCSEGSFREILAKNKGSYSVKQKTGILRDIACTLFQVYALDFLYGDIRMKNIMVDKKEIKTLEKSRQSVDPEKYRYYLNHWGNASMQKTKKLTALPLLPLQRYIAPEVFKTLEIKEETEVYAFGLMIFEVIKEEMPWKDVPDATINTMKTSGDKCWHPDLPEGIPKPLRELIESCTDKEPSKRPKMVDVFRKLRTIEQAMP